LGSQRLEERFLVGELPRGLFGIHKMAVNGNFEDTSAGPDQLCLGPKPGLDLGRQTGGSGLVVSNPAVFDGYFHELPPVVLAGSWLLVLGQQPIANS
jgi:hypothetical protein